MFPFLEADFTLQRVKSLNKISKHYTALGYIAGILSFLPRALTAYMFHVFASECERCSLGLCMPTLVQLRLVSIIT